MVGRVQIEIGRGLICIGLLFVLAHCSSPTQTSGSCMYSTDSLRSGDIILRRSYGLVSDIIVLELNDTLDISHCGIIIKEPDSSYKVIHSLSKKVSDTDGIQICELGEFMADSKIETVRVFRFLDDTKEKIAAQALRYLKQKMPFDETFDATDSTAFYCSELPVQSIRNAYKVDVSYGAKKLKFSVFLQPDFFREIPFVSNHLSE